MKIMLNPESYCNLPYCIASAIISGTQVWTVKVALAGRGAI